jgi:molybdopterin adenylyltransferase
MPDCAVLTVSDTRSEANDASGDALQSLLTDFGFDVSSRRLVTDDRESISQVLTELCDLPEIKLVITAGGTGLSPRDNTPEATRDILDREAIGIAEAMRRGTSDQTPAAMLSRGTAGTRSGVLIVNLPGSPKAVQECFEVLRPVLKHAVAQAGGSSDHG